MSRRPKTPKQDHSGSANDSANAIRLQKYIAEAGICSRRNAESLIRQGRVSVDGRVVTELGTKVVPGVHTVHVQGKRVQSKPKRIFLFYKPKSVVTTLRDPQGRRDISHFTKRFGFRLFPVGRLDFDASGLLLLTNNGDFAEQLLHPRYQVRRVYWALVHGRAQLRSLKILERGIQLPDGFAKAARARMLDRSDETDRLLGKPKENTSLVEVVVESGRKHFVKSLLRAIRLPVLELCRVRFGPYPLANLKPGQIVEAKFDNSRDLSFDTAPSQGLSRGPKSGSFGKKSV